MLVTDDDPPTAVAVIEFRLSPLETRANSPELTVAVIEPTSLPVLLTVSLALSAPVAVNPSVKTIEPSEVPGVVERVVAGPGR